MNCCQLMDEDGNGIQTLKTNMENAWRPCAQANRLPVCGDLDPISSRFYIQQTKMSECIMEYFHHLLVLEKEVMFYVLTWV